MKIAAQLAKHIRDVHFGGNWTVSNMKDTLTGMTWQQATTKVHNFNTILTLVYHTYYYIGVARKVLEGGPLDGKDKYSFEHPDIQNQEDWDNLLNKIWEDVNSFAELIEKQPDSILEEPFSDGKYGTYYRNIAGMVEHTHYHLGQMVLIKKLLLLEEK